MILLGQRETVSDTPSDVSLSSLYVRHAINNSSVQSNIMYIRVRLHITLQSITAAGHTDITSFERHKG